MASYIYRIKDAANIIIGEFYDLDMATIFIKAYYDNYYAEEKLALNIERIIKGTENE